MSNKELLALIWRDAQDAAYDAREGIIEHDRGLRAWEEGL